MLRVYSVPDNPELYVNNIGEVFTKDKKLKQFKSGNGYRAIHYKGKTYSVHRLVARAFHHTDNIKLDVNHKDGNKKNNYADNLEWCTRSENILHAYRTGLSSQKNTKRVPLHIPVIGVDLEGRMYLYHSITMAKEATGAKNISKVLNGSRSKAGSYNWFYF